MITLINLHHNLSFLSCFLINNYYVMYMYINMNFVVNMLHLELQNHNENLPFAKIKCKIIVKMLFSF